MNGYLYFDRIKEHRGSYFIEYEPPVANSKFATLNLIFLEEIPWQKLSDILDKEIRLWISRYPVPLMATAWDEKENILRPNDSAGGSLIAWISPESGEVEQSRDVRDLDRHLEQSIAQPDWREIYTDLKFRTYDEVKAEARGRTLEQARHVKLLKFTLVLWVAVIPAGYAIFEFLGPEWLEHVAQKWGPVLRSSDMRFQ